MPTILGRRRVGAIVVVLASLCGVTATTDVAAATLTMPPPACQHPTLVLAAMPLELYPLLRQASVDPADIVRVNDRTFYPGRLAGNDVVLAMTGIGLVNAEETATAAFEHFQCPFRAAVSPELPGASPSSAT
jgi:hypothetical protein